MKILICTDSFKESMTSIEACKAIEEGIKKVSTQIETQIIPMADGGEGTSTVLNRIYQGEKVFTKAHDAYNRDCLSYYYRKDNTAIIEIAAVSGLEMIPLELRHPLNSTSYGMGEVMMDAINHGCNNLLIGLGGSACNDGGIGMLEALGSKFYDLDGNIIRASIENIERIHRVELKKFPDISIKVACDVTNPYIGKKGATYVFGPQKGATKEDLDILETKLSHLDHLFKLKDIEATGAAGGCSGALLLIGGKLESGIDMILNESCIDEKLKNCDLCISGEGSIDEQSINGKTISGIAKRCKRYNVPLICLAGRLKGDLSSLYEIGVTAAFSINDRPKTLEEALKEGKEALSRSTENIIRLFYKTKNG